MPQESLRIAYERLEAYRNAFVSLHLRLESDLSSDLAEFSMEVTRFLNRTVDVHRTRVVEQILSLADVLELKLVPVWRCYVMLNVVVLYLLPISTLWLAGLILRRNHLSPSQTLLIE